MNGGTTLTEVLDTIDQRIDGGSMSMGEMLNLFRYKGYGPLLLVPTVIVVLPTGAIPGVPTACGLIIALVALQIVLGKPSPWIPRRLREVSISRLVE
ncbi:exopolysaccharide biosynthesis protein [Marinobacteraceae bacterium S3BR75-40.1]